jgi:hypothetical protein
MVEITTSERSGNFHSLLNHVAIPCTATLLCKFAGYFHDKKGRTKFKFLTPYIPLFWVILFFLLFYSLCCLYSAVVLERDFSDFMLNLICCFVYQDCDFSLDPSQRYFVIKQKVLDY